MLLKHNKSLLMINVAKAPKLQQLYSSSFTASDRDNLFFSFYHLFIYLVNKLPAALKQERKKTNTKKNLKINN